MNNVFYRFADDDHPVEDELSVLTSALERMRYNDALRELLHSADRASVALTAKMDAAESSREGDGREWELPEERRVYRETVIVDNGRILIGVPTGESDPWPPHQAGG